MHGLGSVLLLGTLAAQKVLGLPGASAPLHQRRSVDGFGNKNSKLASQLMLLVQKLEANAKFVEEKRAKVDFAPKDRTQVDNFLRDFDAAKTPLGAYIVGQRKSRTEKAKLLEEARKEDDKKRREEEKAALEDDMMDSDEDMDDDDEDEDDDEDMEDEFDVEDDEEEDDE
ncbi:hypothetical protein NLG97_g5128 [Lecanicillium saksenae]|uniref:Uncharacterized protein n=1 Tax=Lecanicillium saksenae TaxID=468837 RepID=A0ACC1QTB0_9HYPO|nr:hypothetical protein NLG97_g5128 [Lecanicillium saksenae]